MRGKAAPSRPVRQSSRITPAYAGKSRLCYVLGCFCKDHPRVCGEKKVMRGAKDKRMGSPPRMRGKACLLATGLHDLGITPAYAGKRQIILYRQAEIQDHPRVCGEKRDFSRLPPFLQWITPAYAGKRLKRSRSTVPPVAIVPLFPSVCNKPVVSDGSPAGRDAPLFLPAENAVPASPAYNLRSL